eukprot:scaffold39_cov493-Prasinococcus_capsulatus_cf.AAC.1
MDGWIDDAAPEGRGLGRAGGARRVARACKQPGPAGRGEVEYSRIASTADREPAPGGRAPPGRGRGTCGGGRRCPPRRGQRGRDSEAVPDVGAALLWRLSSAAGNGVARRGPR